MKIGIITNPRALGLTHDLSLGERLQGRLGAMGAVIATHSLGEIEHALKNFRESGCEIIGICGGDGTTLAVITASLRVWNGCGLPAFAILRGGTANTVAKNFGLRGRPETLTERLIRAVKNGGVRTVEHELLCVNDHAGFIFGAGMSARFMDAYYSGLMVGLPWAAVLAARVILSGISGGDFARELFAPILADVHIDGERVSPDRFTLMVAATVPDAGLSVRVAYRAGTALRNQFHFVASGMSAGQLAAQAHRVFGGQALVGEPHIDRLAQQVEIDFVDAQFYVIDGELHRAQKITLAAGPRIRLVA